MFQTLYVGKLLGIKVYIHWTFWLLAIYIALSNLGRGFGVAISALGFVFAVFGCVFLHEMGHAMAAKWFGIKTVDITLLPIGGLARMEEIPRSPVVELVIALAGPMVNVIIAMVLILGLSIHASFDQISEAGLGSMGQFEQLLVANIVLAAFNMLPSFPMDGGRVLRSLLAMFMPYSTATRYAARTGQVMAVIMLCAALFFWNISLLIIAIMVFLVCTGELLKENLVRATEQLVRNQSPFGRGNQFTNPHDNSSDTVDAVDVRRIQ